MDDDSISDVYIVRKYRGLGRTAKELRSFRPPRYDQLGCRLTTNLLKLSVTGTQQPFANEKDER